MREILERKINSSKLIVLDDTIFVPATGSKDNWVGKRQEQFFFREGNYSDLIRNTEIHQGDFRKYVSEIVVPLVQGKNLAQKFSEFCPASKTHPFLFSNGEVKIYSPGGNDAFIGGKFFQEKTRIPITEVLRRVPMFPFKTKETNYKTQILDGSDKITIVRQLDPFCMRHGGLTYAFSGPKIAIDIEKNRFGARITKPYVVDKNYNHPFVYNDGSICFNDLVDDRWERDGISFSFESRYNTINFALMATRAMEQGRKNLMYGYKNGVTPIHKLNMDNFFQESLNWLSWKI
jgi:hypothetical protein